MKNWCKKILVLSLSAILFSQSVMAALSESNFWKERNESFKSHQENQAIQLAALPTAYQNPPSILGYGAGVHANLSSWSKWSAQGGKRARPLSQNLKKILDAVPFSVSSVQSVHDSGDTTTAPVLLIQDVHMNSEAQSHIAQILQSLMAQQQVGWVGVEGVFEPFDFSPFRSPSDNKIVAEVSHELLEKNQLAAPSYAGIVSSIAPPPFVGIDDREHYNRNVQAFQATRSLKDSIRKKLMDQQNELAVEKSKLFSETLKKFDEAKTHYHQGSLGLGDYLEVLHRVKGDSTDFVIEQFLEATRMENQLDFKKVNDEQKIVLEKLSKVMTSSELSTLLDNSMAYRLGKISFGAFYKTISNLCESKNIELRKTPNFDAYVRYVMLSDALVADQLFTALQKREEIVLNALAQTQEELNLSAESDHVLLSLKLLDFSLTPQEWVKYKSYTSEYRSEEENLMDDRGASFGSGADELALFEQFYEEADIRSHKMVENLLSLAPAVKSENVFPGSSQPLNVESLKPQVLVVGGFHTPAITNLLQMENRSYVVVSPKISKVDNQDGTSYLTVFAKEKTPLDKLFLGEKLFLAPLTNIPEPACRVQLADQIDRRLHPTFFSFRSYGRKAQRAWSTIGRTIVSFWLWALPYLKRADSVGAEEFSAVHHLESFFNDHFSDGGYEPTGINKINLAAGMSIFVLSLTAVFYFISKSSLDFMAQLIPEMLIGSPWMGLLLSIGLAVVLYPITHVLIHDHVSNGLLPKLGFLRLTLPKRTPKRFDPSISQKIQKAVEILLKLLPGEEQEIEIGFVDQFFDEEGLIDADFPWMTGKSNFRSIGFSRYATSRHLVMKRTIKGELLYEFSAKEKGVQTIRLFRWNQKKNSIDMLGSPIRAAIIMAYEDFELYPLGEEFSITIGDLTEFIKQDRKIGKIMPWPHGVKLGQISVGLGSGVKNPTLTLTRTTSGEIYFYFNARKNGQEIDSVCRWNEKKSKLEIMGNRLDFKLRSAYKELEAVPLGEEREIVVGPIDSYFHKKGVASVTIPMPNGRTLGSTPRLGIPGSARGRQLVLRKTSMGDLLFEITAKQGRNEPKSICRWNKRSKKLDLLGSPLRAKIIFAYDEFAILRKSGIEKTIDVGLIRELVREDGYAQLIFPWPEAHSFRSSIWMGPKVGHKNNSLVLKLTAKGEILYELSAQKNGQPFELISRWDPVIRRPVILGNRIRTKIVMAYEEFDTIPMGTEHTIVIGSVKGLISHLGIAQNTFPWPGGDLLGQVAVGLGHGTLDPQLTLKKTTEGEILFYFGTVKGGKAFSSTCHWDFHSRTLVTPNKAEARQAEKVQSTVNKAFDNMIANLSPETIAILASRWGVDMSVVAWKLLSAHLNLDEKDEEVRNLLDMRLSHYIHDFLDREDAQPSDLNPIESFGSKPVSQRDIHGLAKNLEGMIGDISKSIESVEAAKPDLSAARPGRSLTKTEKKALLADAGEVAIAMIEQQEEAHFFSVHYQKDGKKESMADVQQAIARALADDPPLLVKEALNRVLKKVRSAVLLQKELHKRGIKKSTFHDLYQRFGVEKMHQLANNLLADQMGLGKTLQSISTFLLSNENEMVVMAPQSALIRWAEDLRDHTDLDIDLVVLSNAALPDLKANKRIKIDTTRTTTADRAALLYRNRAPPRSGHKRIILVNYELMPFLEAERKAKGLGKPAIGFLVLDEAQHLTNPRAKVTEAILGNEFGHGRIPTRRLILVTGTPLMNDERDLFGLLATLYRGSKKSDERIFNEKSRRQLSNLFRSAGQYTKLFSVVTRRMVRRLSKDVLPDLPVSEYKRVLLNMDRGTMSWNDDKKTAVQKLPGNYERQSALYELALSDHPRFAQQLRDESESNEDEDFDEALRSDKSEPAAQIRHLIQTTLSPGTLFQEEIDSIKEDAIVALTKRSVDKKESVLIFSTYKEAGTIPLRAKLIQAFGDDSIAYVDGDLSESARLEQEKLFQSGQRKIMLVTGQTMGEARQLTQASTIILANLPWNDAKLQQWLARVVRPDYHGRHHEKKKIEIFQLEVDHKASIDRALAKLIRRKAIKNEAIMNGNPLPELLNAIGRGPSYLISLLRSPKPEKNTKATQKSTTGGLSFSLRFLVLIVIHFFKPDFEDAKYDRRVAPLLENALVLAAQAYLLCQGNDALSSAYWVWGIFLLIHFIEWVVLSLRSPPASMENFYFASLLSGSGVLLVALSAPFISGASSHLLMIGLFSLYAFISTALHYLVNNRSALTSIGAVVSSNFGSEKAFSVPSDDMSIAADRFANLIQARFEKDLKRVAPIATSLRLGETSDVDSETAIAVRVSEWLSDPKFLEFVQNRLQIHRGEQPVDSTSIELLTALTISQLSDSSSLPGKNVYFFKAASSSKQKQVLRMLVMTLLLKVGQRADNTFVFESGAREDIVAALKNLTESGLVENLKIHLSEKSVLTSEQLNQEQLESDPLTQGAALVVAPKELIGENNSIKSYEDLIPLEQINLENILKFFKLALTAA